MRAKLFNFKTLLEIFQDEDGIYTMISFLTGNDMELWTPY
jgi:hypothetical protein